jgi:hypothetical protein
VCVCVCVVSKLGGAHRNGRYLEGNELTALSNGMFGGLTSLQTL